VRGYLVLAGTPEDRIDILEQGRLEGMREENYLAYLQGSGLDESSIAGREAWGAQVQRLYADARQAMIDLGIIRE
jgi:hypothetical protein